MLAFTPIDSLSRPNRRLSFAQRRTHRLLALVCLHCAVSSVAVAQDEPQPIALEEVTVTGSRIVRDGVTAPTPVTVVSAERVANLGATNIGQVLNTLPSFRASANPQTANIQPRNAGITSPDLRGLGTARTLVLVDGRRFIPSTLEGAVDLNQIPTLLIERTEIVTGGASAQYGSDAVAGVVNLILKSDLDGVRTQLQYGQTEAGDGEDFLAGFALGSGFAGGRGHATFALEYENNEGAGDCYSRDWCAQEYQVVGNTGASRVAGLPSNNILPNTHTVSAVVGGLILNGPLAGTAFQPDGTPYQYNFGQRFGNPLFMVGGDGYNGFIGAPLLVVPVERYTSYLQSDFALTDSIDSIVELSYGHTESDGRGAQTRDPSGPVNITIRGDNPYLPAALQQAMQDAGLPLDSTTSFNMGRMGDDFGYTQNLTETDVYRALVGLKGSLVGSWTWDAYYQYGETSYDQRVANNRIQQQAAGVAQASGTPVRIQLAADAVINPANGQVVCRSTLANPNNGCQPVNLFGLNNWSAAAQDYLYGTAVLGQKFKQHVVAANVQGDLFETWAGAVPLAGGVEYRTNEVNSTADPISASSGFYVFNSTIVSGDVEVKEAYLETVVPLARDLPGASLVELNGAARKTDYDTSGSVTTWKYGAVYEPVDWLRLRATNSRDIRAPNLDELFRPRTSAFATVNTQLTPIVSGGNPNLTPEEADTFTVGATVRAAGALEGLRASVDYYDIDIDNAISTLTAQTLFSRCVNQGTYCDLVTLAPDGQSALEIRTLFQNLNRQQVSGFDFEVNYNLPLSRFSAPGNLNFGVLATRLVHLKTTDISGTAVDRAGVTGNNVSGGGAGLPEWQVNALVTYATGPLSLTLESRYIDSGLFDATLIGPEQPGYSVNLPNSINTNRVASRVYFNLGATYQFAGPAGSDLKLFFGVQNLLDRDPPVAPSNQGSSNLVLFDPLGRAYRLGLRASF